MGGLPARVEQWLQREASVVQKDPTSLPATSTSLPLYFPPCPCATHITTLPQGEAIAVNLREMFGLRVPIISVVIGEGGSGGALAIGCANRNLIMENRWAACVWLVVICIQ